MEQGHVRRSLGQGPRPKNHRIARSPPKFEAVRLTDGVLRLRFTGSALGRYAVEISEDLAQWTDFETVQAGPDGSFELPGVGPGPEPTRFYRLRGQ